MSAKISAGTPQAFLVATLLLVAVAAAQTPAQEAAVDLAKKTLAEKLRTEADTIELVSVERSRWRGPDVACGSPSSSEAEVAVSGYLVRLRARRIRFETRVTGGKAVVCGVQPDDRPRPVGSDRSAHGTVETELHEQAERARADLAKRLSMAPEKIETLEAMSVVWRDSSAGCPKKGMEYMQVLTPGVRVRLRAGGLDYQYHGRKEGPLSLCEHPSDVGPLPTDTK